MFNFYPYANQTSQIFYYIIVLITFIYLLQKFSKNYLYTLIILIFYPGLFLFFGKTYHNIYQILVLIITFYVSVKWNIFKSNHQLKFTYFLFTLFVGAYFISALFNNDTYTIILSQFSRYVVIFCLFFLLKKEVFVYSNLPILNKLIYHIIVVQIVLAVAKLVIFQGVQIESIVGSISHIGGAIATIFPILGFITLWFMKQGKLERKEWLMVVGLMLIGFLAGKRAIWFIMPVFIFLFMVYVPKVKLNRSLWFAVLLLPIVLYLGFRLTPTLNPEKKVWGSFDFEYALDYAQTYQFGDEKKEDMYAAQGRGDATLYLLGNFINSSSLTQRDWFGSGLGSFYSTTYEEFNDLGYGLAYKGAATGFFQSYITIGYFGSIATILLFFSMILQIKHKRIKYVIFVLVAWEYFMYTGLIIREVAMAFMWLYFIHYANYNYQQAKLKMGQK